MSDPTNDPSSLTDALLRSAEQGELHTVESLAACLPGFSREAVAAALDALAAAGVLQRETGPAGEPAFRYAHPERYRLIDTPVVKQPGPDCGRR